MRSIIFLLGSLILLSLTSLTANACSCGGTGGPCESFGSATAVFSGTVVSMREGKPPKRGDREIDWTPLGYKFSVDQAFSGVAGTEIEVFTGQGAGDCGYNFKIGERYLVYAYSDQKKLTTSICTRTKLFTKATEDLAFLGTLSSAAKGVTIYGGITRSETLKNEPLDPDIQITIEGESQRKEIRPDDDGRFRVSGLPPGKYKVTLQLPDTLATWRKEEELTVSDRGCAAVGWVVTDNGRVNGRVINPDGRPVPRILVGLVQPGANPKENHVKLDRTDDEGNFEFSAVPRGRYLIAVNHTRFPEPNDPAWSYPPTFYPGVIDEVQAQVISVKAGEQLNDLVVRVPPKQPAAVVKVSIVWADGSPVAKAILTVTDLTQGESSIGFAMTTDERGQYALDSYIGQKLLLSARSDRPYDARNGGMERAEPVKLTVEQFNTNVRIVITKLR